MTKNLVTPDGRPTDLMKELTLAGVGADKTGPQVLIRPDRDELARVIPAKPTAAEKKAAPDLAAAVHELDARRARSRQRMIGASEIGECQRRAAYRIARKRPTNKSTGLQAALGTMLHKGILGALKKQYGGFTEVRLQGEQIKGSADWLDWSGKATDEATIEDLKTTSKGGYEKVLTRGAYEKHWYQVTTYAWLSRTGQITDRRLPGEESIPVQNMRIRYLSRDDGSDHVEDREYDPLFAAEAIRWLTEVYLIVEEEGVDAVPRQGFGPGIDSMCDWCPFLDLCWGPPVDPEVEADESRQSRLTVTDEDFVQAVADYDQWRKAEAEAKRHKEFARERLRGRTGVAGDLHCAWSGGNELTQVDKEAALQLLIEQGVVLPTKVTRSPRSIRVKKNVEQKVDAPKRGSAAKGG